MVNYFRRLDETEKFSDLRAREKDLERSAREIRGCFRVIADSKVRVDLRLGYAGLVLSLKLINASLSALRFGIVYSGNYAEQFPNRIERG